VRQSAPLDRPDYLLPGQRQVTDTHPHRVG